MKNNFDWTTLIKILTFGVSIIFLLPIYFFKLEHYVELFQDRVWHFTDYATLSILMAGAYSFCRLVFIYLMINDAQKKKYFSAFLGLATSAIVTTFNFYESPTIAEGLNIDVFYIYSSELLIIVFEVRIGLFFISNKKNDSKPTESESLNDEEKALVESGFKIKTPKQVAKMNFRDKRDYNEALAKAKRKISNVKQELLPAVKEKPEPITQKVPKATVAASNNVDIEYSEINIEKEEKDTLTLVRKKKKKPKSQARICITPGCGEVITGSSRQKFCTPACNKRYQRMKKKNALADPSMN